MFGPSNKVLWCPTQLKGLLSWVEKARAGLVLTVLYVMMCLDWGLKNPWQAYLPSTAKSINTADSGYFSRGGEGDRSMVCRGNIGSASRQKLLAAAMIALTAVAVLTNAFGTRTQVQQSQFRAAPASDPSAKWTFTGNFPAGVPTVGDLFNDGRQEIIVEAGPVYCLSGTGALIWRSIGDEAGSNAAIADLNGDGNKEIVAAIPTTLDFEHHLYCLNSSGGVKWADKTGAWFGDCSPLVADVDGDGKQEILVTSEPWGYSNGTTYNGSLYCFDGSGGVKWSYPGIVTYRPAVADLKGDGKLEIIAGSGDNVYCLSGTGISLWNYSISGLSFSPPAIGGVAKNGRPEIVVGCSNGLIICLNSSGNLQWSYAGVGSAYVCPTIVDIDGDGKPEIIVSTSAGETYCLSENGTLKWKYSIDLPFSGYPVVGDVDSDGQLEILVTSASTTVNGSFVNGDVLYCLDSRGALKWTYAVAGWYANSPVVADVDGDGKQEIIMTTVPRGTVFCLSTSPDVFAPPWALIAFIGVGLVPGLVLLVAVAIGERRGGRHSRGRSNVRVCVESFPISG
jgi:hypothetical protein